MNKKELKEQYLQMKSDMGIFIIKCKKNNKYYIEATQDLKSRTNRAVFQLKFGSHPNKELQSDWKEFGEDNFILEISDRLEYDKDEMKTDYTEELEILKMVREEKLVDMESYK